MGGDCRGGFGGDGFEVAADGVLAADAFAFSADQREYGAVAGGLGGGVEQLGEVRCHGKERVSAGFLGFGVDSVVPIVVDSFDGERLGGIPG